MIATETSSREGSVEITGDFLPMLEVEYERQARRQKPSTFGQYFFRRMRGYSETGTPIVRELQFELLLMDMVTSERLTVSLVEGQVPSGRRIPPGTYSINIRESCVTVSSVWRDDWYVHVSGDSVDLANAEPLSDLQLKSLLAPPPVQPAPAPTPRRYRRNPRIKTDSASRLGLTVGEADGDVICANGWSYLLFHLPSAAVIGSVSANVEVKDPRIKPTFYLRLHDASGEQVLTVELTGRNSLYRAEFDQIRLKAGDYVCAIFALSVKACGSYRNSHVGFFGPNGIPARPLVDDLMKRPAATPDGFSTLIVGFPQLKFLPE